MLLLFHTCILFLKTVWIQMSWGQLNNIYNVFHPHNKSTILMTLHNWFDWISEVYMGLHARNLSSGFVDNKGPDQPTLPPRLISTFVIRFLDRIISRLDTREISFFLASFWSWGDWLACCFVRNPKDRFRHIKAYMSLDAKKPVFGGLRTTKAQTSLRIRADWSALCYLLFGAYHI